MRLRIEHFLLKIGFNKPLPKHWQLLVLDAKSFKLVMFEVKSLLTVNVQFITTSNK